MGVSDGYDIGRIRRLFQKWKGNGRIEWVGGCLIWRGPVNGMGYAHCEVSGERTVQRLAWIWAHDRRPHGVLRNECGNRLCVNPKHWREDVRIPSRLSVRREEMRKLHGQGLGIGEIADRVGCSRQAVSRFVKGLPVVGLEDLMGDGDD